MENKLDILKCFLREAMTEDQVNAYCYNNPSSRTPETLLNCMELEKIYAEQVELFKQLIILEYEIEKKNICG